MSVETDRARVLGLGAAIVLAVLVGTGVPARAQVRALPRLAAPAVVRIGLTDRPITLAGLYIATARGYFKDANITNEFVAVGGMNALVGPLATGDIDIATGGVSAGLFNAIERGVQLRIIGDQHTAFPGRSAITLMVRKDLIDGGQVKTMADLKGRPLGLTTRRATIELTLTKALRAAGVGPGDLNIVTIPFAQMNAAFASRALDAAFQVEPLTSDAVAKGLAVRWRGLDELAPNLQNVFLVASERFAQRQDVARAWMVAYVRGVRDYNDAMFRNKDREAVIRILMDQTLVKDRALYDRMVMPGIHPDGEVNVASITEMANELRAAGDIKGGVPVERIIDLSFARYAHEVLGPYGQ
jgi:NitT/TauT family transport system substrate-binding protein